MGRATTTASMILPMQGLTPAELDDWVQDRHSDLQDAMIEGDGRRVLEITSKMAEGAELQIQWAGGMVPGGMVPCFEDGMRGTV